MNITASIQARMGSNRLPGKVLKNICGKPMLQWQIERIRRSRLIDRIIVATTDNPLDNEIVKFCEDNNVEYYRGSENDVLGRIAGLIRESEIEIHAEFYGDSPLVDVHLLDEYIGYYLKYSNLFDYLSNSIKTTYPPGMEINIYSGQVLMKTDSLVAADDPMREHVAFNITRFPEHVRLCALEAQSWYFGSEIYLEVDSPQDLIFIEKIISYFTSKNQDYFSLLEILKFIQKNPDLTHLNQEVERRWKAYRNNE